MSIMQARPGIRPPWEIRSADEGQDDGDEFTEIRAAVETLTTETTNRVGSIEQTVTELRSRLDRAERALKRPGAEQRTDDQPNALETRAFETYVRRGREAMMADEVRSLRVSSDTDGGVLAPEAFIPELQRNVVLFSPVRTVANVRSIGTGAATLPRRTGGMTATWTGDTEERQETTVTFGAQRYEVAEITAYVDVPNSLLEDSAFDIGALLSFEFGEEFGVKEGAAFVNGNGAKKPMGFMTDTTIAYTPSGSASAVTADGLIDLFYALPTPYRGNAVWAMSSATTAAVRKLKATDGHYLWQDGLQSGQPATLLGRPVVEMPDMPAVEAGAFPIVFGDFRMGYRVFDRVPLSLLRDPYSQATKGMTRFHGRRRVAGGVAKAEAIRKLKIATS